MKDEKLVNGSFLPSAFCLLPSSFLLSLTSFENAVAAILSAPLDRFFHLPVYWFILRSSSSLPYASPCLPAPIDSAIASASLPTVGVFAGDGWYGNAVSAAGAGAVQGL